jgi:hypothetical protein
VIEFVIDSGMEEAVPQLRLRQVVHAADRLNEDDQAPGKINLSPDVVLPLPGGVAAADIVQTALSPDFATILMRDGSIHSFPIAFVDGAWTYVRPEPRHPSKREKGSPVQPNPQNIEFVRRPFSVK